MTQLSTAQPGLFDGPLPVRHGLQPANHAGDDNCDPPLPASLAAALPQGLLLHPALIDPATEAELLATLAALPLTEARYKAYTARRRVLAWGAKYDFDQGALQMGSLAELPQPLQRLRDALAAWTVVEPGDFAHAMVSEYRPGTPLGWHRDAPGYELVAGVSLASPARMRFRPWSPPASLHGPKPAPARHNIVALDLAPRSAYLMRGPARWAWQHSVAPVPALRYSVTMRTLRR